MAHGLNYSLTPKHIFGINSKVKQNVHYLDEQTVLYSAGNNLIVLNTDSQTQKIYPLQSTQTGCSQRAQLRLKASPAQDPDHAALPAGEQTLDANSATQGPQDLPIKTPVDVQANRVIPLTDPNVISTMSMSRDRRWLAIGAHASRREEQTGPYEPPVITIMDLTSMKRRKTFPLPDIGPREIISLSFSWDSVYLLAQTGYPDYTLYAWNWERNRLHGRLQFGDASVSMPYKEDHSLAVGTIGTRRGSIVASRSLLAGGKSSEQVGEDKPTAQLTRATEINQASFSPFDGASYQICLSGNLFFRVIRFTPELPTGLRITGQSQNLFRNYTCHAWLSRDRQAVATLDGKLFIAEAGDIKYEIPLLAATVKRSSFMNSADPQRKANDEKKDRVKSALNAVAEEEKSKEPPARSQLAPKETPTITIDRDVEYQATEILAFGGGFVVGTTVGKVVLFEYRDQETKPSAYHRVRDWDVVTEQDPVDSLKIVKSGSQHRIQGMCLSPSEDAMLTLHDNQQVYRTFFGGPLNVVLSTELGPSELKTNAEVFGFATHQAPVSDMAVCYRKPWIATCSSDKTVKIWNYLEMTLEQTKSFRDQPVCMSFHPSGIYLVVGFSTSIQLFTMLVDGMDAVWSTATCCVTRVQFSQGGQYMAVAADTFLFIYDTWTQELLAKVEAHSSDVQSLQWCDLDRSLLSIGQNGMAFEWELVSNSLYHEYKLTDLQSPAPIIGKIENSSPASTTLTASLPLTMKKIREYHIDGGAILQAEYTQHLSEVHAAQQKQDEDKGFKDNSKHTTVSYVLGADNSLHEITATGTSTYWMAEKWSSLRLHAEKNLLLATGRSGTVYGVRYPFVDKSPDDQHRQAQRLEYLEFCGHLGDANQMILSRDGRYVMTCGLDGCLIVSTIQMKEARGAKGDNPSRTNRVHAASKYVGENPSRNGVKDHHGPASVIYASAVYTDDVLVGAKEYEKKLLQEENLLGEKRQCQEEAKVEIKRKESSLGIRMQEIIGDFEKQVSDLKGQVHSLVLSKEQARASYASIAEQLRAKQMQERQNLLDNYNGRIQEEQNKFQELEKALQMGELNTKLAMADAERVHAEQLQELRETYEGQLDLQQAEWQQIKDKLESTRAAYFKNDQDLEDVVNEEVTELRTTYELLLREELRNTASIRVENQKIRCTYDSLLKTIQANKKEMQGRQDELRKLTSNIQRLQSELTNLQKEQVDGNALVAERDKNVQEERRRLQDIEKAKFILESHITSEKEQVEPRERLCQAMREQTRAMRHELQFLKDGRKEKTIAVRRLENRLAAIHKQWNREKQRVIGFQITMDDIAENLHEIMKGAGLVFDGFAAKQAPVEGQQGSRVVSVEQRLKTAMMDFYHRHCDLKGLEQLGAQPKGYIAQSKSVGDPLIEQVMNVPFVMERMAKESTVRRAVPSKMSKSDNNLDKSFASSRDRSVASSNDSALGGSGNSLGTDGSSVESSLSSKSKSTKTSQTGNSRDDSDTKKFQLESTIHLHIPTFNRPPESHSMDVDRVRAVLKSTAPAGTTARRTLVEEIQFQRNFKHDKMAACHWQSHKIKERSLREKRAHVKEQEILLAEHNELKRDHEAYVEKVLGKFPAWAEERSRDVALKAETERKAKARLPMLVKSRL